MLITILSIFLTALLTTGLLALYLRRTIPLILSDVGASVGEQLSEVLAKPMTQRAMAVLGKKSGEVRANSALRERAAEQILGQSPLIGRVLDELNITPIEGLQLLQDPIIGPWIQKGLAGFMKNLGNPGAQSSGYGSYP